MRVIWLLALCVGCVFLSTRWAGGAQQALVPSMDKESVARGEIWFYQRCALCHMERIVKDVTYRPLGPALKGLLRDAPPSKETQVRDLIKVGTFRMPGFQYGLDDKELDEVIAFLKTH